MCVLCSQMFASADVDGNGVVNWKEFVGSLSGFKIDGKLPPFMYR